MDIVTKEVTVTAAIEPVEGDTSQYGEANVILSTNGLDRDGERLEPDEWKLPLPEYITFDTDHGMSVATTVGGGEPFLNGDGQLQVPVKFASIGHAQNTRTLVNERIIRNVSVTFLQRKNAETGKIERELLNGSFVAIPANPQAVVLSSKAAQAKADKAKVDEALAGEPELTVCVSGGYDALKKALATSEVTAYRITAKSPPATGHWCESDACCADGSTDGANAPLKSLSGKSADAADPAAPEAAGSAALTDEADIELAKAKALALAIELS
jgi:hypothetical protein